MDDSLKCWQPTDRRITEAGIPDEHHESVIKLCQDATVIAYGTGLQDAGIVSKETLIWGMELGIITAGLTAIFSYGICKFVDWRKTVKQKNQP